MIPVAPALSVRPLGEEDSQTLAGLIGELVGNSPYSAPMDEAAIRREIFASPPPVVYPLRWQQHCQLGAWRAGQLIGFLDAAVGLDSDSLDLPDYHPLGLIRFLALPGREDLVGEVATALLDGAQNFWQETGVGYVKAFHVSTGYPSFQAGAGILPGDWADQVRVLTQAGFRLIERYYCLYRLLDQPVEEVTPLADLSLVYRGVPEDRIYQIYYRRIDWVGHGRLVRMVVGSRETPLPIAYLTDLEIDPRWRQQNIGTWLLRRLINDATLQGCKQMVVHLAHRYHTAVNLFAQQGFQELGYRGYTLDKTLTA